MAMYPLHGERYQHIKGWTVYILAVKFADEKMKTINPEFYCEVQFIYENSGRFTEMPFAWFNDVYQKIDTEMPYPPLVEAEQLKDRYQHFEKPRYRPGEEN